MTKIYPFRQAITNTWAGGTTTELLIFPQGSKYADRDFGFRISSATVEAETSDFTALPGYNRLLAVLEGKLEIIHADKYTRQLLPFGSDAFHGSWKTSSKGQARDFNVIYSDDFTLDFAHVTLSEKTEITRKSDFLFLFLLNDCSMAGNELQQYDLLEITDRIVLQKEASFFKIKLDTRNK